MEKVTVYVDWDDNFGACVEGVCCVAVGDTLSEVKKKIRYSLPLHLASMREDGDDIPLALQGAYELVFSLSTQAIIKAAEAIVTQPALSRAAGVNRQQLSHYATGCRNPRPAQRERILKGVHRLGQDLLSIA
ncbi:MAG: type II toxin-antitoxin system HicB family antitoxin [Prevotellaceae bacterium]|jgi:predicted RNase H-like HicB family nuclease|nr:type II toxin-antitoxin system HicB family antitoxin [Prevotellaceae bacterium]